jgi:hypothetical protein
MTGPAEVAQRPGHGTPTWFVAVLDQRTGCLPPKVT